MVKVTREKTENSQAFLTIEMEPAEVEESLSESYKRLVKKTRVPGFRKGKAPRGILERHIGKDSFLDDAIKEMLPQAYEKAIKEQDIEAFARGEVEVAQKDPVIFKAVVPLQPTVELGDYHSVRVEPKTIEVTEEDVNSTIEHLRHQHATWEPVERPVEFNDLVVLNIQSSIEDKPFINRIGVQYQVVPGLSFPAPGFAEQLPGMKRDEEKEFKLQFPADDTRSELAGKEVTFKVKVGEVKREVLPEVDDNFAKEVAPEFENLDALRERVLADLKTHAEQEASRDFEDKMVEEAVNLAKLEFPPVLVEMEIDRLLREQLRQWQMDRKRLEEYLKSSNKTAEQLREEFRPIATKRTQQSLVLGKIAQEEKIEVSDTEIDQEIEKMVANVAENKDDYKKYLNTPQSRSSVWQMILTRKTIERLGEIARGKVKAET